MADRQIESLVAAVATIRTFSAEDYNRSGPRPEACGAIWPGPSTLSRISGARPGRSLPRAMGPRMVLARSRARKHFLAHDEPRSRSSRELDVGIIRAPLELPPCYGGQDPRATDEVDAATVQTCMARHGFHRRGRREKVATRQKPTGQETTAHERQDPAVRSS